MQCEINSHEVNFSHISYSANQFKFFLLNLGIAGIIMGSTSIPNLYTSNIFTPYEQPVNFVLFPAYNEQCLHLQYLPTSMIMAQYNKLLRKII